VRGTGPAAGPVPSAVESGRGAGAEETEVIAGAGPVTRPGERATVRLR